MTDGLPNDLETTIRSYQTSALQQLFGAFEPDEMRKFIDVMGVRQDPVKKDDIAAFVIKCKEPGAYVPEIFDLYESYENLCNKLIRYEKLQKYK